MKPLWILVVLLVICVCAAGVSATDFSLESFYTEQEVLAEEWLRECPGRERIIVRSPIDGEPIYWAVDNAPVYISKEDVREVVRQVLAEEELPPLRIVARSSSPAPREFPETLIEIGKVIKVNGEVYDCDCLVCNFLRERWIADERNK